MFKGDLGCVGAGLGWGADHHLSYKRVIPRVGDQATRVAALRRSALHTDVDTVDLDVPRDRNGDFEPRIGIRHLSPPASPVTLTQRSWLDPPPRTGGGPQPKCTSYTFFLVELGIGSKVVDINTRSATTRAIFDRRQTLSNQPTSTPDPTPEHRTRVGVRVAR